MVEVKPIVVKEVNQNGNTIIKTNDVKYIQSMKDVQTVVQQIKTEKTEVSTWSIDSVVTVDYGTS